MNILHLATTYPLHGADSNAAFVESLVEFDLLTDRQLQAVLDESGVDMDEAAAIADSIMDWRDSNDLHMLNGAEEDYYQDLDAPYSCKDGKFDSIGRVLAKQRFHEQPFQRGIIDDQDVGKHGNTPCPMIQKRGLIYRRSPTSVGERNLCVVLAR